MRKHIILKHYYNLKQLKKDAMEQLPLELINKYKLVKFNNNSKNVALLLESTINENTELTLRQFSKYLPEDFAMWIYVTKNVYDDYIQLVKKLDNNITVMLLPNRYNLTSIQDYNTIMLDISFWKLLDQFDRVLIFQLESLIYHYDIEKFYKYDYISAPINPDDNPENNIYKSGLSLRNIKAMIHCLEKIDKIKLPKYDKYIQENIFYSHAMDQLCYNLPDEKTSSLFSIESYMHNENSFGSYKLQEYDIKLYSKLLVRCLYDNSRLSSNVYIIGGVYGGGSLKYINDIKEYFPNVQQIRSNDIIQMLSFSINDILLVQHLIEDITPKILIEIKKKYECRIIVTIHDFYWINSIHNSPNGYLLKNNVHPDIINLFKEAELIIHPSNFTYKIHEKYFSNNNFVLSKHIDFKNLDSELNIPMIENKTINIGVMHDFNIFKGCNLITHLINTKSSYNGYNIQYKIIGKNIPQYNENEFFQFISKYNIHCLTLLNVWGETYCYALSKFLKSGLPIIYNSLGAVTERMPKKDYYFQVFNNEANITIDSILEKKFTEMLKYIIDNNTKKYQITSEINSLKEDELNLTLTPHGETPVKNDILTRVRLNSNLKYTSQIKPKFTLFQKKSVLSSAFDGTTLSLDRVLSPTLADGTTLFKDRDLPPILAGDTIGSKNLSKNDVQVSTILDDTIKNKFDLTIEIPLFYTNLITNSNNLLYINRKNPFNIKVYCIYFPQYHSTKENDINYYKDYTDMTNLNLLINDNNINKSSNKLETPSFELLPITNILEYDLHKNPKIIQNQVNIINNYNISGFAIYYYWFSKNTITNSNMIMENVINLFFSKQIKMKNRKVFFIWANESWSKNIAFGNNKEIIENNYDEENIIKNIDNLMLYFKHTNYLKIDNKPVFFLHHPWFIPRTQLDLFKNIINKKCLENKFDGCHLIINSMNGIYENYKHYDHTFNYHNSNHSKMINGQISLDYQSYINNIPINNNIKTIAFNFDNRARLYKPNRLKHSTVTINNNEPQYLKYMNKLYSSYSESNDEIDKIMLVNSWNEWGEQMAIEPSNERGTYYIDLLKTIL